MVEAFIDESRRLSAATAGRAENEFSGRLDSLREELNQAERAVEAFRAENDLVESQGRLITDEDMLRLNDQLASARAQVIELEAKARSIREASTDAVLGGGLPEAINSPVIGELRAQYAQLRQQAESLGSRLGPRHPQRIAIESQLRSAREQMAAELRRIAASAEAELRRAQQQAQQLADRLAQMKVRQGDISGELVTLRQLEREAGAKRNVYETYLLRARDAGEQKDIDTSNISVIGKAQPPLEPEGPSRTMIVVLFTILGFVAGVLVGAVRGIWWDMKLRRDDPGAVVATSNRSETIAETNADEDAEGASEEKQDEDTMFKFDAHDHPSQHDDLQQQTPQRFADEPADAYRVPPAHSSGYGHRPPQPQPQHWQAHHQPQPQHWQAHHQPVAPFYAQPQAFYGNYGPAPQYQPPMPPAGYGNPRPSYAAAPYPYEAPPAPHYPAPMPDWQAGPSPYQSAQMEMERRQHDEERRQRDDDRRELDEMRETVRSLREVLDGLAARQG